MILLLTLIVGFLFLASWGLKKLQTMRFMQPGKESLIQLVDRRALSPKSCIWIVDIDNVRIAVGESHQQGIQLLHTWEKE